MSFGSFRLKTSTADQTVDCLSIGQLCDLAAGFVGGGLSTYASAPRRTDEPAPQIDLGRNRGPRASRRATARSSAPGLSIGRDQAPSVLLLHGINGNRGSHAQSRQDAGRSQAMRC